jgi:LmbE family N-acetylglucosaminyl deacetylase
MQIEDLRQIHDNYDHVYLSPHLDDAALSCGGAILSHGVAGKRVLVVTLCTGIPAADASFSELARRFHEEWGLSPAEAVTARLNEDTRSMERLGVDWYWAGLLDAIYRVPQHYNSEAALFGTPMLDDPLRLAARRLVEVLHDRIPRAALYGPLGVGGHVDHQLTLAGLRDAAAPFRCYEDVPYVYARGALERRKAMFDKPPSTATEIDIVATLDAKIEAIACYASQMKALFGGLAEMRRAVADYARTVLPGGGERLWALPS